jgi:hypothetical protein
MSDMMFHDHNDCMQQYYKTENQVQLRNVGAKAKHLVNYARYTDIPSGHTGAVLTLSGIAAVLMFYAGMVAGL